MQDAFGNGRSRAALSFSKINTAHEQQGEALHQYFPFEKYVRTSSRGFRWHQQKPSKAKRKKGERVPGQEFTLRRQLASAGPC
jgi:hypothetical protein